MNKNRRKELKKARKRKFYARYYIFGGAGLVVLGLIVFLIIKAIPASANSDAGTNLEVSFTSLSRDHIQEGTDPGPYSSDPPAGGHHYPSTLPTKFYQESDVAALPVHPEAYLVHNLEHGYVIFWYNCQALDPATPCDTLKAQIKSVMDQFNGVKVIAFPWKSLTVPLAMTSWGKVERFAAFDQTLATNFVLRNRYKAPEPDAQ